MSPQRQQGLVTEFSAVVCPPAQTGTPRWLHYWAMLTICATFVLLTLGAVVTTFNFGMADRIWPTYPWHLALIDWEEPAPGFLIEHGHRLAGYVVGCCVIVLALGLWWGESRRWVRWLALAALLGVIVQGLLGGFRVRLDALLGGKLKLIHGCFSQVVFGLLVSLAVCTGRRWHGSGDEEHHAEDSARLRWLCLGTAALIYLQIVLGAILRHTYSSLGQRGHLLVAFAVVAAVAWLTREYLGQPAGSRQLPRGVLLLAVLTALQIFLGVETWMVKFLSWSSPARQALVRTVHVLAGYLLFGTAVAVTVWAHRRVTWQEKTETAPVGQLEGVA
jgi:cytochrome c oxidase assembly protein subunit 15